MANLSSTIKLKLDSSSVKRGIKGIKRGFTNMGKSVANIATGVAKFAAAVGVAVAAFAVFKTIQFFKDSSKVAADMETLAVSFEVLLGSASAATARMKELKKFSLATPFTPKEVINASKLLQTLGGSLLATGKGLELVGDAAATTAEAGFGELALHIGRVFGAITSGTSAGEAVSRLQELGLITGDVKLEFENLAAAQKKGEAPILSQEEALKKLQGALSNSSGMMAKLAETAAGKFSTLEGNIDNLKEALGTGLNEGLKVGLDGLNEFLPQWEAGFKEAGERAGNAIARTFAGDSVPFQQIEKVTLAFFDVLFAKVGEMAAGYISMGVAKGFAELKHMAFGGDIRLGDRDPKDFFKSGSAPRGEGTSWRDKLAPFNSEDFQATTKGIFGSEEKMDILIQVTKDTNEILTKAPAPAPPPDPTDKPWSTNQPPAGWTPLFATP